MEKIAYSNDILVEDVINKLHLKEWEELYEITYSYKKIATGWINQSFFVTVGGLEDTITTETLKNAYHTIFVRLHELHTLIETFLQQYADSTDVVYSNALRYYRDLLQYTLCALPFEGLKTGLLTETDIQSFHSQDRNQEDAFKKLKAIDAQLFGPEVKEIPDELEYCVSFLQKEYKSACKKQLLSPEELQSYKNYIDICCLGKEGTRELSKPSKSEINLLSQVKGTINREDYVALFATFLRACEIDKKVEVVDGLSAVFDSQKSLQIPGSDAYAVRPKQWVLKMMIHEIETHFISEANHDEKYTLRGGYHLASEEGLAKGLELLFAGNTFHEIGYTVSLPTIMAGELLSGKDFLAYLRLRAKGLGLNDDPEDLYLRRKRGYPEDLPGVQHNDTAYSRGIRMNQDFIAQGGDYKDFYLGKLDIRDFEAAKLREKELGLKRRLPKLLTEVVLKKLIGGRGAVQNEQFKEYIAIKYPFLKSDDIMNAGVVSKQTKQDLVKIISLLRK